MLWSVGFYYYGTEVFAVKAFFTNAPDTRKTRLSYIDAPSEKKMECCEEERFPSQSLREMLPGALGGLIQHGLLEDFTVRNEEKDRFCLIWRKRSFVQCSDQYQRTNG